MSDFTGTSYTQPAHPERGTIEVCRYPDRKSVSVGILHGNVSYVLAYFVSVEAARVFVRWMSSVAGEGDKE